MDKVWKSNLNPELKKRFFVATVESILLYGCESWAVNDKMEKMLNGTYTNMLRRVLSVHWSSHTTNEQLYGKLPVLRQDSCQETPVSRSLLPPPRVEHPESYTMGANTRTTEKRAPTHYVCGHPKEGHRSHQHR